MRLTLRGLLAYLDDRLDPAVAAQVGDYIGEHDKLRHLIDRIKRVIRRRRLSTPEVAERQEMPVHHQDDPNQVAAFLDGRLPEDQEADFEEICLDTDVYLAEVAAVHQIMTFGNATLKVPPLATQRMVNLVKGPEAQPLQVVPRQARPSKSPLWDVTDSAPAHEEENQALLEPLYHNILETRWGRGLLIVAALLLAGFMGFILFSVPWDKLPSSTNLAEAQPTVPTEKVPVASAPAVPEEKADVVKAPVVLNKLAVHVEGFWPALILSTEKQPVWLSVASMLSNLTGMVAARPALPLNTFLGFGEEVSEKPLEPLVPLPVVASAKSRVAAAERNSHVPVAINGADVAGMFLQLSPAGDWRIMKPQSQLTSNELLQALPGYTGNIALPNGVRIMLLGQFHPNLAANPFGEAVAELHPTTDADADLTLHRGRMVIIGRTVKQVPSLVRVRYQGETWELSLPSGSEVGLQAGSAVKPGDGPWVVEKTLEIIASKGKADVKHLDQATVLAPKQRLLWNSSLAENEPARQTELGEVPVWLAKYQTAPKEAVESLVGLRSRTHAKLQKDTRDMNWLSLACDETLEEGKLIERQAALLELSAIGRMQPIIALLNDANANGRRKYSHDVVHYWLNQEESRAAQLIDLLKDTGYSEDEAKLLLTLYRGTKEATPATIAALLQDMASPRVAIREQAWRVLTAIAPERPNIFDPIGAEEQRTKAISLINTKLTPKKANVPPPP
ncbi:MAG TPA: hypothetical protein PLN21_22040 [Gemmatales bacterium]|nr:hypothetical protein [Gemmatales bacterium]